MCKDGRLHVKVQDSKFYPCFYAGQYIYIEKYVFKVGFSETKIVCPDCREICGECAPEIRTKSKIGDYKGASPCTIIYDYCTIIIVLILIR
ncbi:hypothetical protein Q1695_001860 [Nippostrongylus brasiliensis]|nr:hypothetical protein Q1695_001860 [Nippostrongylus brasiliensis]